MKTAVTAIFALLFLIFSLATCTHPTSNEKIVVFSINPHLWLESSKHSIDDIDHYGIMVVDVYEKTTSYQNPRLDINTPIEFELIKARPYYILLIAYDKDARPLNYVEREISI